MKVLQNFVGLTETLLLK